jgi:micrococcal nuclease
MYEYKASVVRIVDGDTVLLDLDLGFYMLARMSCRLAGLNCIELNQPGGSAAKTYLASLLPLDAEVVVKSVKPDKYAGRFDAVLTLKGVNINNQMIADGYAAKWDGKGTRPVPPWPIPLPSPPTKRKHP